MANKGLTASQKEELERAKRIVAKFKDNSDMATAVDAAQKIIDDLTGTSKPKKTAPTNSGCPTAVLDALESIEKAIALMEGSGASLDPKQIEALVKKALANIKIGVGNLDQDILELINKQREIVLKQFERPDVSFKSAPPEVFFMALSDLAVNNNVYLYGGAGTGKTYTSEELAEKLNATLITINCNQYTSPLEIQGGQTIDGYQEGKLIVAWGNLPTDPDRGISAGMKPEHDGCLLLLDELPKMDPNTAGMLNDALAKTKETGKKSEIQNAKGERFEKKRFFCIATGNSPLNRDEPDYVANFKQDLSLQDRFIGSVYEVFVNLRVENEIMNGYQFIFLYMNELRKLIQSKDSENRGIPSMAFVSLRIMISLRDSWTYWYENHDAAENKDEVVKTLRQGLDSFFGVFMPSQSEWLRDNSNYNEFLSEIKKMSKLPLGTVTDEQKKKAEDMVADFDAEIKNKRK